MICLHIASPNPCLTGALPPKKTVCVSFSFHNINIKSKFWVLCCFIIDGVNQICAKDGIRIRMGRRTIHMNKLSLVDKKLMRGMKIMNNKGIRVTS